MWPLEAVAAAEWVGDDVEGLAQVSGEHVTVGQVAGDLAQPVHIVAEGQQPGVRAGVTSAGSPHPARACHFAEMPHVGRPLGAKPV